MTKDEANENQEEQPDTQDVLVDATRLSRYLKEAKEAHSVYEKELGKPDLYWEDWYAQYIVTRAAGEGY